MKKTTTQNTEPTYSFYSRVLEKPFDTLEELIAAEKAYYDKLREKEDKAAQKKADAKKVEEAFKDLNLARKTYKENLTLLTNEYSAKLDELKNTYEFGKKDITDKLSAAEQAFDALLKKFADAYGQYHFTLKGDDFETTISGSGGMSAPKEVLRAGDIFDIFNLMFNF